MTDNTTADQPEVWLPVPDYDGVYEASNLGRVRRQLPEGLRMIAPVASTGGYRVVSLSKDGVATKYTLARVILSAFCGPAPFAGAHAAHNSGDVSDNRLVNLRWATPTENQADVDRHGHRCKGEDVFGAVLDQQSVKSIRARCALGERNRPIAEDYGVSVSTIHLIRHNRIWKHVA